MANPERGHVVVPESVTGQGPVCTGRADVKEAVLGLDASGFAVPDQQQFNKRRLGGRIQDEKFNP